MKSTAESALAKIRRQRKGEAKATEQYEVRDENAEIYETVTEEAYQKLKETRRAQHWVEGEGYSDDGEEWWDSDSGGDFVEEDSLEDDEGEEEKASSRRNAGGKRKKSVLEHGVTKGVSGGPGGKRPRKGRAGGAAGDLQQQQQSMRMRSLVQHFSARAAETAALQQQQRLTQRDAESLRNIDKLLEEEEDTGRVAQTTDKPAATSVGRGTQPGWCPTSSTPCAASLTGDPRDAWSSSDRTGGRGGNHQARHVQSVAAAGRRSESREIAANSQDFSDFMERDVGTGLESTQRLDGEGTQTGFSSDACQSHARSYSAPETSFLEQLGLGSSFSMSYDRAFCAGRSGDFAAQRTATVATRQNSSSTSFSRAGGPVPPLTAKTVADTTQCRRREAAESCSHSGKSEDAVEAERDGKTDASMAMGDGATTADDDTASALQRERPSEEGSERRIDGDMTVRQEKDESLFKSTGEFEQHKIGSGGVSLLKHAEPDFFLWGEDEDEPETASKKSTALAGKARTNELKTHNAVTSDSSLSAARLGNSQSLLSSEEPGEDAASHIKKGGCVSIPGGKTPTPGAAEGTGEENDRSTGPLQGSSVGPPCSKDGTMPFYFLDAWEEDGLLFMFGKVWLAAAEAADGGGSAAAWKNRAGRLRLRAPESCCIVVRDMMVPLFFRTREQVASFPAGGVGGSRSDPDSRIAAVRTKQKEDDRKDSTNAETSSAAQAPHLNECFGDDNRISHSETLQEQKKDEEDEEELLRRRLKHRLEITRSFFTQDAQRLKKKYQWRKVAIKGVFRHFAFDSPGVPREREQTFVKMYVPAGGGNGPLLDPEDWEGEAYSHVFGTRASLVELLLVKRRIKGPCWLRIRDFSCVESPLDRLSWCKHEVVVHSHKAISCWDYTVSTPVTTLRSQAISSSLPPQAATSDGATRVNGGGSAVVDGCNSSASGAAAFGANSDADNLNTRDGAAGAISQAVPPPPPPPLTVISVCVKPLQVLLQSNGSNSSPHASGGIRGSNTVTNGETNQLAIAAFFVYRNADVDDQAAVAPRLTPQTAFCAVRRMRLPRVSPSSSPLDVGAAQPTARVLAEGVPLRFPEACAQQGFALFDSERSLLLTFVNQIAAADPDILLGHDIYSGTLDLLAQRLAAYALPVWHRLSRLKRGKQQLKSLRFPSPHHSNSGKVLSTGARAGGTGFLYGGRLLTVGRLVCDTYLQSRELLPHRVDYDLPNLLQALYFPNGLPSPAASAGAVGAFSSSIGGAQQKALPQKGGDGRNTQGSTNGAGGDQQRLAAVVRGLRMFPQHQDLLQCFQKREPQPLLACMLLTLQEAYVTLLLCWRLNCLPLTRELTTIGGNLWNRSLQNQRAERNALLLLHEFHKEKYICPDPPLPASLAAAATRRQLRKRNGAAAETADAAATQQQQRHRSRSANGRGSGHGEEECEDDDDDRMLAETTAFPEDEEDAVAGSAAMQRHVTGGPGRSSADGGDGAGGSHASYTGGLVLEPRVGYYETFVLLLDFNSLYPSIIQEFNVCFSTVKRGPVGKNAYAGGTYSNSSSEDVGASSGQSEAGENAARTDPHMGPDNSMFTASACGVQGVSSTPGVLPRILRQLVQRRRAVKVSMKAEANPIRRAALDVKQLALKLTANSIYGCLGFSHSRFYARDLAAFITQQGRNVLLTTKEKVERVLRLEVLYGDTDSLMINTGLQDDGGTGKAYAQAVRMGEQVKAEINRNYRSLEIDLEAVFRRLLLLRKKKYACCIVVDYAKRQYRLEQKGLDFVRRDWAKLTRVVGQQLLEILFSTTKTPSKRHSGAALSSNNGCAKTTGETQRPEEEKMQGQGQQQPQQLQQKEQQSYHRLENKKEEEGEAEETVDAVVERLHGKLEEVARQLREKNKVPLEYFVITKALTKLPHLYPRGAGGAVMHPHVQVALRMQRKGVPLKPGTEIPFVICTAGSARAVLYPNEDKCAGDSSEAADIGKTAAVTNNKGTADTPHRGGSTGDNSNGHSSNYVTAQNGGGGHKSAVNATDSSKTSASIAASGGESPDALNNRQQNSSSTEISSGKKATVDSPSTATGCVEKKVPMLSAAERAFHPREVLNNNVLEVDVEYYIEQQLLPPVLRLCAHVQGTNAARLAQCLGLDAAKHARGGRSGGGVGTGGGMKGLDDSDDEDEGNSSREARERAGEEQILALLARTDEKYKHYMRCPACLWWISPSTLSNFVVYTLAALQRRFTQAVMRCTTCGERYVGLPTPPAALPRRQASAGAVWQQRQEQQARAAAAAGWLRCPRCEEGRVREEMNSHDMYIYLDQLLFYLSGDVTSQQRLLAGTFSPDEQEKAGMVWKHFHCSNGSPGRAPVTLNGACPRREENDAWLIPAGLDANLRVRVLNEGKCRPPSGSVRQSALGAASNENAEEDMLDDLYGRVSQQEVKIKRGAQLRYPGLTAAVTYWQKSKRGLGWIDMQRERNKLRTMVNEVMDQNAYRMLKLTGLYSVMRPPFLLDPTKRRWHVVEKLNVLKCIEAARDGWNEELRCRAPTLMASLEAAAQSMHASNLPSVTGNAAFDGFGYFATVH